MKKLKIHYWLGEEDSKFRKEVESVYLAIDKHIPKNIFREIKFLKFFTEGIGSVVGLIEGDGQRFIIKTQRWKENSLREEFCLKEWAKIGVRVPKVHSNFEVKLKESTILVSIFEFIEAITAFEFLNTNPQLDHKAFWEFIWESLGKMHKLKTSGFGKPVAPSFVAGNFPNLKDYILEKLLPIEKFESNSTYDLETKNKVRKVIDEISRNELSTFGHSDLGLHNLLGTGNSLVVIDPHPTITHPYFDLAVSYIWALIQSQNQSSIDALVEGYKKISVQFDLQLFSKFLLVRLLSKQLNWTERIEIDPIAKESLQKTENLKNKLLSQIT